MQDCLEKKVSHPYEYLLSAAQGGTLTYLRAKAYNENPGFIESVLSTNANKEIFKADTAIRQNSKVIDALLEFRY